MHKHWHTVLSAKTTNKTTKHHLLHKPEDPADSSKLLREDHQKHSHQMQDHFPFVQNLPLLSALLHTFKIIAHNLNTI